MGYGLWVMGKKSGQVDLAAQLDTATVASFRIWRGSRTSFARGPGLLLDKTLPKGDARQFPALKIRIFASK
jgi:hypothetical protein